MDYRDVLSEEAVDTLVYGMRTRDPDIDATSTLEMLAEVASQRAELLGRPALPLDFEVIASILCKWPLKTLPPPNVESVAARLWTDLSDRYRSSGGDLSGMEEVLPRETLTLSAEQVALRFYYGEAATQE